MKGFFASILLLASFAGFFAFVYADTFSRNLKLGDTGKDVQSLQIILNKNKATQLAQTGPCSPGNETDYFGLMTQGAVKRFQEQYASDILLPVGLSSGTGYVGEKTRAKLENLSTSVSSTQNTTVSANTTSTQPQPQNQITNQISQGIFSGFSFTGSAILPITYTAPILYYTDPYEVVPGGTITLHGSSFNLDSTNTVSIGSNYSMTNLKSSDGTTLIVQIPISLAQGKYEVWVTNPNGSSRNTQTPISFIITNNPKPPPHIISVSPTNPSSGDVITITGENFTATGNNLYSTAGEIHNLPSPDGKTVSFSLSALPYMSKIVSSPTITSFSLWFTVQNDDGADKTGYKMQVTNKQQ